VARALRTPDGFGHEQFVAATTSAGDVAVHRARARDGLTVTSVAAAPDAPAAEVLAAAHEVAGPAPVRRRSLYDLPLGDGPLWTLTERATRTTAPDGREERCAAVLPAWAATGDHDLDRLELGFPAAAAILAAVLRRAGTGVDGYAARQSAMARYTRVGFEAAAVTAIAMRMSLPASRDGLVREAVLRFGHPYAVVATPAGDGAAASGDGAAASGDGAAAPGAAWRGLPVFSAWVAEPAEVDEVS
jgi:hypothetical protein